MQDDQVGRYVVYVCIIHKDFFKKTDSAWTMLIIMRRTVYSMKGKNVKGFKFPSKVGQFNNSGLGPKKKLRAWF